MIKNPKTMDGVIGLLDYVARNGTTNFNMDTVNDFRKMFLKICPEGSETSALRVKLTPGLTRNAEKGYIFGDSLKYKSVVEHKSHMGFVNGYTINFCDFFKEQDEHSLNLALDEGIRFSFAFDRKLGLYLSKPKDKKMPLGKREEVLCVFR